MKRFGRSAITAAGLLVSVVLSQSAAAQAPGNPTPAPSPAQPGPANPTSPSVGVTTDGDVQGTSGNPPVTDQSVKLPEKTIQSLPKKLLWRGTTFSADQSVSSETAGIGRDYQSSNPSYQLWFSLRPRVYLFSDSLPDGHSMNVNARLDMYKEITDSDDTTRRRENYFGDIWLTGSYAVRVNDSKKYPTTIAGGPRVLLPTSVASRGAGTYLTAGGGLSVSQGIHLSSGDYFSEAHVGLIGYYTKPITPNTTAVSSDLSRDRIATDGRTLKDNQLSGGYLVNHQLLSIMDAGLQITPKAGFSVDMIFLHQWRHGAKGSGGCDGGGAAVTTQTGTRCAISAEANKDPQTLRVSAFPVISFDYQVLDELNLAVGYYNFTNLIGPDGKSRSFFYAPESSRFFLTATLSLDVLYKTIVGSEDDKGGAAVQGRLSQRQKMLQNLMTF